MATEKRLIDVRPIIDECNECIAIEWNHNVYATWAEAEEDFKQRLLDAPTVDAVEVVHGEWTVIENDYDCTTTLECSVCEMAFCFEEYDGLLPQAQTYHYCPNCGAHMRDGDGNG